MSPALLDLEVLVIDCQATAAAGHMLEVGWARARAGDGAVPLVEARLVRLPEGGRVPPAVARITGIHEGLLARAAAPSEAWRDLLAAAARSPVRPAPAVAHFARFERPFLAAAGEGVAALDLVCTHEVARRLLPSLPRRSLRALAGYFGQAVGPLRRAAEHVAATAIIWRELVALLAASGVTTWGELRRLLATPVDGAARARKVWPMPRALRLALPDAPGLYRMLRGGGDVLYVGKASSLRARVNSYFRKQRGIPERTLEMLSQARDLSFVVTESALEAALLEPDEIKRHRPPYNVALTLRARSPFSPGDRGARRLWFAAPDLSSWQGAPSGDHPLGPFPSPEPLAQLQALAQGDPAALGPARWGPPVAMFTEALARLTEAHPELRDPSPALAPQARLLRLGGRLWREGRRDRRDRDEREDDAAEAQGWTPELTFVALEWVALRAGLALRRARWLSRLARSSLVWREPALDGARLLVIADGEIVERRAVPAGTPPPPPPGARGPRDSPTIAAAVALTVEAYDRLSVLGSELKRLVTEGTPLALRLGHGPPLDGPQLQRVLDRV